MNSALTFQTMTLEVVRSGTINVTVRVLDKGYKYNSSSLTNCSNSFAFWTIGSLQWVTLHSHIYSRSTHVALTYPPSVLSIRNKTTLLKLNVPVGHIWKFDLEQRERHDFGVK